jgi:membrane associated rhomboid family serine protease
MLEDRSYMRQSPFETRRSATLALLVTNIIVFVIQCVYYGYPPAERIPRNDVLALSWTGLAHGYVWQLITFQFLHANFWHLLFNGWAIFVFGREVEETLGVKRFLTLYFASGAIGGLLQAVTGGLALRFAHSPWGLSFAAPAVGASAGCFGLIAAFAMLYPERSLTLLLFLIIPVGMRAKFLLAFEAILTVFGIIYPASRHTADIAHLGGMLTGIIFIRYALHWNWHWPRLRRTGGQPPRRLVRVGSGPALRARSKAASEEDLPAEDFLSKEVDPILDKISAHGIHSLTERERRVLEAARQRMGKR